MAAATVEGKSTAAHIPDIAANVAFMGLLWFVYGFVRDLSAQGVGSAFDNADAVLDLQRTVGLDIEAQVQAALGFSWLLKAANWYYLVHFPVTVSILLGTLVFARHSLFVQLRNSMMAATSVALLVHVRYPLAPPRMLEGYLDTAAVFGPNPYALPGSDAANQFAAMPSMHVGWAVLVALVLWAGSSRVWVRALGVLHATVTSAVVIVTANHYVLDVLIGAILAVIAWFAMGRLAQFRRERLEPSV